VRTSDVFQAKIEKRDETLRELADAHAELADAQNRELFAKIEKRDETLRADGGE